MILLDEFDDFEPVHLGKHQIENENRIVAVLELFDCLPSLAGAVDVDPFSQQEFFDQLSDRWIIFHDEGPITRAHDRLRRRELPAPR